MTLVYGEAFAIGQIMTVASRDLPFLMLHTHTHTRTLVLDMGLLALKSYASVCAVLVRCEVSAEENSTSAKSYDHTFLCNLYLAL